MKGFVLALVLSALTACTGVGSDPTVACPSDPNKQLTREEWRACNGLQEPNDNSP